MDCEVGWEASRVGYDVECGVWVARGDDHVILLSNDLHLTKSCWQKKKLDNKVTLQEWVRVESK